MIYATPVKVLQELITPAEFVELMTYDHIWGLERHQEIVEQLEPAVDVEAMARARFAQGPKDGRPKPGSLNRRTKRNATTR